MALLGIRKEFEATHGSRKRRKDKFTVECALQGPIKNGFVSGIDHDNLRTKLEEIVGQLTGRYLDDIVGRATNENIALYIMSNLDNLPLSSVRIYEGVDSYVEISADEFNKEDYPSQLEYNLGHSLLIREDPESAKKHFTNALRLREDFAEAHNMRGRCLKYLGEHEQALGDFLKSIELKPDFGEAWRNLGNTYLNLKKHDEMIPAFDKSIELMPDSALAINNRGYAYFVMDEFELALRDHNRAVEIDPNYAEAHHDRGMALRSLGKENLAEEAFEISRRLKETGKDTYHKIKTY